MIKVHDRKQDLSQTYIKNVKLLFPMIRKQEKAYFRQMKQNIDDYCADNPVSSLEELYQEFGSPQEALRNYYSMLEMVPLMKYIRLRRMVKYTLILISAVIFSVTVFFCARLYQEHSAILQQEAVYFETTISDPVDVPQE